MHKEKHEPKHKQLKAGDVPELREQILEDQNGCCGICGQKITEKSGVSLDHQHKRKIDPIGLDGGGLIRGVLCRACNVWEGKIWNGTRRYHQPKCVADRIELLQQLIEYYENGTYSFVHPSEKPKAPTVSKRNYNKLKKQYTGKRKFPEYPRSKKLTLGLQVLFEEYEIEPYN